MFVRMILITALAISVSGCGKLGLSLGKLQGRDRVTFDGQEFRGSAKANDAKDRQHFVASVRGVSKSLEGAVLAAEHEGVRHCIRYYGTSDIAWDVGPDTPREALIIDNDTVTLMGTCVDG